jgi:hypothetical protein
MKTVRIAIAASLLFSADAAAQRFEETEAYKAGFKEGYSRGYREGMSEGEKRGASYAPPPPVAAPKPVLGPITISNAYYGTEKKNCNATHWLSRRVNGRATASVEVENSICGDPAPGARKSLEVSYICGQVAKTASGYEHRTLYLDCTS